MYLCVRVSPRQLMFKLQTLEHRLEVSAVLSALNNTERSNQRILFFNRVTKAGSTSMAIWMGLLAAK